MKKRKSILILLIILAFSLFTYFEITEFAPRRLKVRTEELIISALPDSFDGITIGHLSDIYTDTQLLEKAVSLLADYDPDIIVFTGDLYASTPTLETIMTMESLLVSLEPPLGKFAVLGDNDQTGTYDVTIQTLETAGFRVLANQATPIHNYTDEFIYLIGLDSDANIETAFASVDDQHVTIALSHWPDIIDELNSYPLDLLMAGGNHGGQINLPLIGSLKSDSAYTARKTIVNGTTVLVSSGLGTTTDVRLLTHPEVVIVTLSKS